jgi:hypothetical protein
VWTHQPNATTFVITYDAVPEAGVAGSANTAQLQLFANGRFRLAYGTVANTQHTCVVGFTPGGGTMDPGSADLDRAVPFSTGTGGTPVLFYEAAGTRPTLGTTFTMIVGNAPLGSTVGIVMFGYTSTSSGIPLGVVGMPGCRLYASSDAVLPFSVQGSFTPVSQPLPNSPALVGLSLYLQAVIAANGVNPLGVVVSNAAQLTLGN